MPDWGGGLGNTLEGQRQHGQQGSLRTQLRASDCGLFVSKSRV